MQWVAGCCPAVWAPWLSWLCLANAGLTRIIDSLFVTIQSQTSRFHFPSKPRTLWWVFLDFPRKTEIIKYFFKNFSFIPYLPAQLLSLSCLYKYASAAWVYPTNKLSNKSGVKNHRLAFLDFPSIILKISSMQVSVVLLPHGWAFLNSRGASLLFWIPVTRRQKYYLYCKVSNLSISGKNNTQTVFICLHYEFKNWAFISRQQTVADR